MTRAGFAARRRTFTRVLRIALLIAVALSLLDAASAAAARERWRPPLPGATLARPFTFTLAAPFARGARRGVDLRGAPGAPVVAACGGTVTYAGRVPRWDRGVTLRCGELVATELGLAATTVRRGAHVAAGAFVGRLAPRGVLRLGARRAAARNGYLDPLTLLRRDDPVAPRGLPVTARRRRVPPPAAPVPLAVPTSAAAPRAHALPWSVLAGLGLLAAGAGGGGVVARRRRPRGRTGPAVQPL